MCEHLVIITSDLTLLKRIKCQSGVRAVNQTNIAKTAYISSNKIDELITTVAVILCVLLFIEVVDGPFTSFESQLNVYQRIASTLIGVI